MFEKQFFSFPIRKRSYFELLTENNYYFRNILKRKQFLWCVEETKKTVIVVQKFKKCAPIDFL